MKAPLVSQAGLQPELHMFDNTPIYSNFEALKKWSEIRGKSAEKRAFLYYNSATLHDGNYAGTRGKQEKVEQKAFYRELATKLMGELSGFFNHLEASGRNSVVFLVSEHGRALHGSNFQISGLRDIPLPDITIGPLAVKLIGKGFDGAKVKQQVHDGPTSLMAIPSVLKVFLESSPFNDGFSAEAVSEAIPFTAFVAENKQSRVVKMGADYFLFTKNKTWIKITPDQLSR